VHWHRQANEYTVVYGAEVEVVARHGRRDAPKKVTASPCATVIRVPVGACHTIRALAQGFAYAVLKGGPDDFNLQV